MNARIHAVVEQATELAKVERQQTAIALRGVVKAKRKLEVFEASLRAEERQQELTANLKLWGRFCWKDLNNSNKWKKENVLAVFVSGRIPAEFTERLWYEMAPESVRDDKDILLVRLAQKDFSNPFLASGHQFRMPANLLNDKPTLIAVLNQCPKVLDQDGIPEEFFNDGEVFRAYIRSSGSLRLSMFSTCFSKFSADIRGNADLMLEATKQGFVQNFYRHLDKSLRDDCCFATQLAETARCCDSVTLTGFSARVRANPEVVLAFVRRNGECLFDAAESLRGHQEIVRAACTASLNDGTVYGTDCAREMLLSAAAGPVRQHLGRDRDFMMGIFAELYDKEETRGDPRLFRMLSENLKLDRDVMVAAIRCGSLSFSDISASFSNDSGFWLDMIRRHSFFWYGLPVTFEQDPAFAQAIEDYDSDFLVRHVFQRFPALSLDRNAWFKIIASELKGGDDLLSSALRNVIQDHLPEQFRLDRELLLRACRRQGDVLLALDPTFGVDRDFVRAAIESDDGSPLHSMCFNAQPLHPDLVIEAIAKHELHEYSTGNHVVAPELWSNFNVWKAWADRGARFHSNYPDDWKSNPEFGLLVLKCASENIANDFMEATTETLRSNKSFMLKAVELNPEVLVCARGGLQHDFDVVMAAFGSEENPARRLANNWLSSDQWDAERPFLQCILNEAEQYLEAQDGFTKAFVHGMTAFAGASCRLSMLANDKHTSLALKQKIAAYAGVPVGKDLRIIRQAVRRLSALVPVED